MSEFTIPLKRVIELTGGTAEIEPDTGIRKLVGGDIGLQYYPIFQEDHRDTLTGKIVDHYWNREIGMLTIDQFQLAMRRKMNEVMPFFNQLYTSELIKFDPLSTVNLKTMSHGKSLQDVTANGKSVNNAKTQADSQTISSETPATMLQPDEDYATSGARSKSTTDADSTATDENATKSETDSTGDSETIGYQGSASALLMQLRESFINIDAMVIRELDECFMLVWDNPRHNDMDWIY